jgi:hypothetical protein
MGNYANGERAQPSCSQLDVENIKIYFLMEERKTEATKI